MTACDGSERSKDIFNPILTASFYIGTRYGFCLSPLIWRILGKPGYWGYAVGGVAYVPQGRRCLSRERISAGDRGARYWGYTRVDPTGNGSSDLP